MDASAPFTLDHLGCRLAYRVSGAGQPVLMIQGVGVHGDGWAPQVEGLKHRYRCLTFDNRGMGLSQPLGAGVTIEQMAEDARALMDAQGWEDAHVVGHSLGGLVSLQLALSARSRVRSLSLLCTFGSGRVPTRLTPWIAWVGLRTRVGPRRWRRRAFLQLVAPPAMSATTDCDALAARLAPLFGHDLADQPPVTMKQFAAMKRYDRTARLGELAGIPTLVVSAAHDRIAPPTAGRALAAGIPGASYVEVPDASHGVTLTQPARINALLMEHFSGASATSPTGTTSANATA